MVYLVSKSLHIIGFVAWFAAMFYIWRLFVYHAEARSEDVRQTLATMERRLYRAILVPASVFTLVFGFVTLYIRWDALAATYWIWIKLALVGGLLVLQQMAAYYRNQLLQGVTYASSRRFRLLNEVPTLILIVIVLLAVLKPF
ncbi:MAG: CopD family protein [Spirochaetales bacterium]|nr:CopD family protein [Leptospiraceae bacterium]MCP5479832.1 CopD family protein [Spirochaetales bacterium]MCP5486222.1 CopD family protein [Spirochaetales bacterium]